MQALNRHDERGCVGRADEIDPLRAQSSRDARGAPLIGGTVPVRIGDRDEIAVVGELAGEEDRNGGFSTAAFGIGGAKMLGMRSS